MTEVRIRIEKVSFPIEEGSDEKRPVRWRVEVDALGEQPVSYLLPLTDDDLAAFGDLDTRARTWKGFLSSLSPKSGFLPGPFILQKIGTLIMKRLLSEPDIASLLDRVEAEAKKVRFLINIEEAEIGRSQIYESRSDPVLRALPLELAYKNECYFFNHSERPTIYYHSKAGWPDTQVRARQRLVIATAAAPEREPDAATLEDHARKLKMLAGSAGFDVEHLPEVSPGELRDRIKGRNAKTIDVLYVACHGMEAPDYAGQLYLRGGEIYGRDLAHWLKGATERQRQVQVVVLCACSSAAPADEEGTRGMAEYLVHPRRAVSALGFRGPVDVDWALEWTSNLFAGMAARLGVEEAFAAARFDAYAADDPQWVLPVLWGHRKEPVWEIRTSPEMSKGPPGLQQWLQTMEPQVQSLVLALATLPPSGVDVDPLATALGEPAPRVARRLDRLVGRGIVSWLPETCRHRLDDRLRRAAREYARARPELWSALHRGAARGLAELANWVGAEPDLSDQRWHEVEDIFNEIDLGPWHQGAAGAEQIAEAVVIADAYRDDDALAERRRWLDAAETLIQDADSELRHRLLVRRSTLQVQQGDSAGAVADLEAVLGVCPKNMMRSKGIQYYLIKNLHRPDQDVATQVATVLTDTFCHESSRKLAADTDLMEVARGLRVTIRRGLEDGLYVGHHDLPSTEVIADESDFGKGVVIAQRMLSVPSRQIACEMLAGSSTRAEKKNWLMVVIDPAQVSTDALKTAASVAELMLTMETSASARSKEQARETLYLEEMY